VGKIAEKQSVGVYFINKKALLQTAFFGDFVY